MKKLYFLFLFSFLSITSLCAQSDLEKTIKENYSSKNSGSIDTLSALEAELKLYEEVAFKGKIISTFYADFESGRPTFLNMDKLFPNNPVVLVIFENDRSKFLPAQEYRGKEVLITGKVELHKYEFGWKSSITLKTADQIKILN